MTGADGVQVPPRGERPRAAPAADGLALQAGAGPLTLAASVNGHGREESPKTFASSNADTEHHLLK